MLKFFEKSVKNIDKIKKNYKFLTKSSNFREKLSNFLKNFKFLTDIRNFGKKIIKFFLENFCSKINKKHKISFYRPPADLELIFQQN